MKTQVHTPGPWHVYAIGPANYIATKSGYTLARVDASYAYKGAHRANANVMSAAPELLAAAVDVAAQLQRAMSDDVDEVNFEACAEMRDTLHAAIAKATR